MLLFPGLEELYCYSNSLKDLNVNWNYRLYTLLAYGNDLAKLDIHNNISLDTLIIDEGVDLQKRSEEYVAIKYLGKASYEELEDDFIRIKDGRYRMVNNQVLNSEEKNTGLYDVSQNTFEIQGDAMVIHDNFYFVSMKNPGGFMDGRREFTKLKLSDSVKIRKDEGEKTVEEFNAWGYQGFELQIENGVITEIVVDL